MFNPVFLYSTYNEGMFLSESLRLFFSIAKSSIENMTNTLVDAYSNDHRCWTPDREESCCWDING